MTVVWAYCPECKRIRGGYDIGNGMFVCPCHDLQTIARVEVPYSEGGPGD